MAGITAIKRKGFKGGGMDASTSSFDKGATIQSPNPSRPDTKEYGATDFQVANQGFTPTQIDNQNAVNPTREQFKRQREKVIDNLKASEISRFEPNKAINYLPFIGGARNILGTPLTKAGKTRAAKRRMEYINSLPPEQRKAMINRLGLASDEDYEEGETAYGLELLGDPLSFRGETPLYGMDAYDIINYDGEFLKRYGQDLTNTGGDDGPTILPYPYNVQQPDEEVSEDTGPEYRFGTGQDVGADVTRGSYIFNQGGRVPRASGGIMNAVPRQGYFLGGIGKAIKGVVGGVADAAGKVLKSDAGKLALLAAGAYYMPGYGIKDTGGFGNMFKGAKLAGDIVNPKGAGFFNKIGSKLLLKDSALGFTKDNFSLMKMLTLSGALPFIPGINKAPENENIGMADRGGRLIDPLTKEEGTPASMRENIELAKLEAAGDPDKLDALNRAYNNMLFTTKPYENYGIYAANGGRIGKAEGGLMNLGGMEKDYRAEGGFVPIGKQEKADDVPARLSVNEFVFTADAVRNAGGGDIDKGAEVMENMMKNLENGGTVSEESQGNTGAQEMFSVSERIGEVI